MSEQELPEQIETNGEGWIVETDDFPREYCPKDGLGFENQILRRSTDMEDCLNEAFQKEWQRANALEDEIEKLRKQLGSFEELKAIKIVNTFYVDRGGDPIIHEVVVKTDEHASNILTWYSAYHAGDPYEVYLNGEKLRKREKGDEFVF